MTVIGIGVDVCDIARFEESCRRTPAMLVKLFTEAERDRAYQSLAARFAAKEALAKALRAPAGMAWHDAEVVSEDSGRPLFVLRGSVLAVADQLGVRSVHLSLTHDSGLASAFVVLEG